MKVFWMVIVVLFEELFSLIRKGFLFLFEPVIIFISKNIIPIVVIVFVGFAVIGMWSHIFMHEPDAEEIAKAQSFIKAGYPTLECFPANPNLAPRIYKAGTYSVEQKFDVGYNVHWTKIPCTDATTFHVTRCEIKKESNANSN